MHKVLSIDVHTTDSPAQWQIRIINPSAGYADGKEQIKATTSNETQTVRHMLAAYGSAVSSFSSSHREAARVMRTFRVPRWTEAAETEKNKSSSPCS